MFLPLALTDFPSTAWQFVQVFWSWHTTTDRSSHLILLVGSQFPTETSSFPQVISATALYLQALILARTATMQSSAMRAPPCSARLRRWKSPISHRESYQPASRMAALTGAWVQG